MSEMIERVARAIAKVHCDPSLLWDDYIDEARAAIEAMRRPTGEMAIAGRQTSLYPARTFAAMIDAALTPAKVDEAR
jgi:hypothetical protein